MNIFEGLRKCKFFLACSVAPSSSSSPTAFPLLGLCHSLCSMLRMSTSPHCNTQALRASAGTFYQQWHKESTWLTPKENKHCALCPLPLLLQESLACTSTVALPMLSLFPLLIESPMGYNTRLCLGALWEKRCLEFNPFVGEEMKKTAVIKQAESSFHHYSLCNTYLSTLHRHTNCCCSHYSKYEI